MAGESRLLPLSLAVQTKVSAPDAAVAGSATAAPAPEVLQVASRVLASVSATDQVLLVTACAPDDRPQALAGQLAAGLHLLAHAPIVLIDGDPDRSALPAGVRAAAVPGLSEVVNGSAELLHAVQQLPGLACSYVSAGRAAGPLSAPGVAAALAELRTRFRFIVISPGCTPASPNALTLAQHANAALMAVAAGRRRAAELRALQDELRRLNTRLLGAVVVS